MRVGSGRVLRRFLTVLAVLILGITIVLLIPAGRALFEDTRDKLGKTKEVSPSEVTASAELPRHPAANATDGLSNRYWGTPRVDTGLSFTFGKPFRLVAVVVHTGTSAKAQDFRRQARPVQADLVVTSSDGQLHHKKLTFNDKPGPQTVQLGISDVAKARLVVKAATGLGSGRHIALAEVEFFRRN
ncbi:NADase-type glycan-binding domain-containing protein [Streptomyces sp. NPDC051218]|uniref:NADase-type glycan-binding domain-containing protein n=1 Tax=Streptomyces sp. NPDC051218 TaxID=3365645 RepID=UPI0037A564B5